MLVPTPHATQFGVGAATKEGWKHDATDLAQQLLLTSQAAFKLGYEIFGEAPVVESLLHDLRGMLRLAAITLQTLLRCEATALSGFGVFFWPSFG
jgi:hypothetical protein